jgi:hypothetical protein
MATSSNTHVIDGINKEKEFTDRMNVIKAQGNAILAEYIINYKTCTDNNPNTYTTACTSVFASIRGNLEEVGTKFFTLSNDIQQNIDLINTKYLELNELIKVEKKKNEELKDKLGTVKNQNNASNEMIQNYKQIYNLDYLKNWGLFLSILIAALTIKKIFIQK